MTLTPKAIYQDLKNKVLDKSSAINSLISLIDNIESIDARVQSIEILGKIGLKFKLNGKKNQIFDFLENLLISDSNESVRRISAELIKNIFKNKAISPFEWSLKHENSMAYLFAIIRALGEINSKNARMLLLDEINKIESQKFKRSLQNLHLDISSEEIPSYELVEIMISYKILDYFKRNHNKIDFEVDKGRVIKLNLSHIMQKHVFGWNILETLPSFISELKSLKYLDLRKNMISKLPNSFGSLSNLEYLDLSYNELKSLPESIKSLKSLKFLDLSWNKITSLPKWIKALSSLEVLKVDGNNLEEILSST